MNKSKKKLWFLLFTILYVMASSEEPEPSTNDATIAPPSNAPPAPPAPEAQPVPDSAGNDNQPNAEIRGGENGEKPGEKPEEKPHEKHEKHEPDHVDIKDMENKKDPFKFAKDVSHIRQHLMEQYGFNDKQADQYLKEYDAQTQFFVLHDYDKNTKLDGLELLKSMTHYHDDHEDAGGHHDHDEESDNTDTLVEFVDMILKDQDYNNDGYIDYPEYINYYAKFDKSN